MNAKQDNEAFESSCIYFHVCSFVFCNTNKTSNFFRW